MERKSTRFQCTLGKWSDIVFVTPKQAVFGGFANFNTLDAAKFRYGSTCLQQLEDNTVAHRELSKLPTSVEIDPIVVELFSAGKRGNLYNGETRSAS